MPSFLPSSHPSQPLISPGEISNPVILENLACFSGYIYLDSYFHSLRSVTSRTFLTAVNGDELIPVKFVTWI